MAKQEYRRLQSEEDGEGLPTQDRNWSYYAINVKNFIINLFVFAVGLSLGVTLTSTRPSSVDVHSEYSMVPCKWARSRSSASPTHIGQTQHQHTKQSHHNH